MSERWISQAKYWCKYCRIYITDNKSSRAQHENGLKHKDHVQRYIRDVQERGLVGEDGVDEKTRQELERIEMAARIQHDKDLGVHFHPPPASAPRRPSPPPPKPKVLTSNPIPMPASMRPADSAPPGGPWPFLPNMPVPPPQDPARPRLLGAVGDTDHVYGAWRVVEAPPSKPSTSTGASEAKAPGGRAGEADEDEDDGGDPESLVNFKFREKQLALPPASAITGENDAGEAGAQPAFKKARTGNRSFRSKP